jgi:hypothetical protein
MWWYDSDIKCSPLRAQKRRIKMVYKLVGEITSGDVLLGEAGGSAEVYDVADGSLLAGFYTVNTEFGPLLLDSDNEVEVQ